MESKIKIRRILEFLTNHNFEYYFSGDENEVVDGFSSLFNYKDNSVTFISSLFNFGDFYERFDKNQIKLIIMDRNEKIYDCCENIIKINKPKFVFFTIIEELFSKHVINTKEITRNIDEYKKQSYISSDAKIGENVKIGIGCVIEGNVRIGDNTVIHHNVVLRNNTKIGENCSIFSGTIIGESGFNPLPHPSRQGKREMIKHYGGVTIEDNVHIGDNCNISRGSIDDTVIRRGSKLNKQVNVAHNVIIGEDTVITAPTFICGSVKIGNNCHIAATVIRNQCIIGDRAVLGLGSVVVKDVDEGVTVIGNPAKPMIKS